MYQNDKTKKGMRIVSVIIIIIITKQKKVFSRLDIRFSFWIVAKYFKSFNNLFVITIFLFCTHSFNFFFLLLLSLTHTHTCMFRSLSVDKVISHIKLNISTSAKNICRENSLCSFFKKKLRLHKYFLFVVFIFVVVRFC